MKPRLALAIVVISIFLIACKTPLSNSIKVGNGYTISVPEGFTIERVAEPDLVLYPMMAFLDERGRLFVAESSGKNVKGKDMPANPECRISLLEDTNGDGVYDQRKVFADKLSLPMGALWHRDSLYVASPPDLLRFDDANDDGIADKREVILTGWNILNTASLHGPFLGPDGWLYLTHGRHGYKIQTKEGPVLEGLASRIWRCRVDGTGLERVAGGGFDNPVELTFLPSGEMIGTMTYFVDPQNGQRDALMHFVEGGVYPKPHPVISEFKRTGDLMPVMTKFARIAPSGLMQYRSTQFGSAYQGNLFSAQFNPHRIQRHQLFRDGATFRTENSDFVTSTDPDFHPTDVMEDADGSLLFLDTGGWYVDACPLSVIAKAEHKGAIYRVRKAGAEKIDDPRGVRLKLETLAPEALAKQLEDLRPAVQTRSLELLVSKGDAAVNVLAKASEQAPTAAARCAAVFGLGRIATPDALKFARAKLNDADAQVRTAAARVAGMNKDREAVEALLPLAQHGELPVRLQVATALGQIGDGRAVPVLLAAAADVQDRFVEHAIIYALIQLKDAATLQTALKAKEPRTRQAALIALDQMDNSPLQQAHVAPLLNDDNAALRRAALFVISHHKDWASAVLNFLRVRLNAPQFDRNEADTVREAMLTFVDDVQVQKLMTTALHNPNAERQLFLLDTIERCALKELPPEWDSALAALVSKGDAQLRSRSIEVVRARRTAGLSKELTQIANNAAESAELRLAAIAALVAHSPQLADATFELLLNNLATNANPALPIAAAQSLGEAELTHAQLLRLANEKLSGADSLTLLPLLDAFRATKDDDVGQALIAALSQPTVKLEAIGSKRLEQLFQNFSDATKAASKPLLARFQAEAETRTKKLRELEPLLTAGGDVKAGGALFFGKATCYNCHAIRAEGGKLGPDLTSVGAIRSGHDILEAIVFPSATLVPDYQTARLTTKAGQTYTGIRSQLESDREAIVLWLGVNQKLRLARDQIAGSTSSPVSLMPEGFASLLTQKELTDLLAFLKAQQN
ncbi:MAG: PVC-type heme-binding CxxCH protein [Blastocatellia bacterium]